MISGDKTKLVKLLNLMASDQDGEALTAARMSVKMIKDHTLTWEDVLFPRIASQLEKELRAQLAESARLAGYYKYIVSVRDERIDELKKEVNKGYLKKVFGIKA